MIKFDKNEFLKPQIYSTLDEYETRCNVTKEIIEEIEQLQQKNKVIDKVYELIKQHIRKDGFLELNEWQTRDLLDILKEVK